MNTTIHCPIRIAYMNRITREFAQDNPHCLFIFGDNDQRKGFGGLARELRGQHNAIGVRVKKAPSLSPDAFWTDAEYSQNIVKLNQDFQHIRANWHLYDAIIYPSAGIGTGLAKLKEKAPKSYAHLVSIARSHGFEQQPE